jgi:hypothetical protein
MKLLQAIDQKVATVNIDNTGNISTMYFTLFILREASYIFLNLYYVQLYTAIAIEEGSYTRAY